MPVSAYVQAALFVVAAAVALLASAGMAAILTFWIYLVILLAVVVAAFIWLDPGLLRERMRPGGKRPPLGLHIFTRPRPRPSPLERQRSGMAARPSR
jgi:hypothetical protein